MTTHIKQTRAMISIGLSSIPRRLWISLSMVLSVALVVAVLVGFLSMAKGFEMTLVGAGSPQIAVILGGGTNQETGSDMPSDVIRAIRVTSGDFGVARDQAGELLMSRELVVPVDLPRASDGMSETLALRGMDQIGPSLRSAATLSEGRLFVPGSRELVVGAQLANEFDGLGIGKSVRLGNDQWRVVGHFSANGSAFESEIWGDIEAIQSAFNDPGRVQSLRVQLTSPDSLAALQKALPGFSPMPLIARSEVALFAEQSQRTGDLISMFGWPLAILMAAGAVAGALNTMMTSVADRTKEIATVRTLGFSRLAAFLGTCGEAIVLSLVGAAIGIAGSWLAFNGFQASTMAAGNAQMAFQLRVTPDVMLTGGLLGLAVGALGGLLAAFSAARVPLVRALRVGS